MNWCVMKPWICTLLGQNVLIPLAHTAPKGLEPPLGLCFPPAQSWAAACWLLPLPQLSEGETGWFKASPDFEMWCWACGQRDLCVLEYLGQRETEVLQQGFCGPGRDRTKLPSAWYLDINTSENHRPVAWCVGSSQNVPALLFKYSWNYQGTGGHGEPQLQARKDQILLLYSLFSWGFLFLSFLFKPFPLFRWSWMEIFSLSVLQYLLKCFTFVRCALTAPLSVPFSPFLGTC